MPTLNSIGEGAVKDVIASYPKIGKILDKYKIGCTKCKIGICKLKNVVKIHYLPEKQEKKIFDEIKKVLKQRG